MLSSQEQLLAQPLPSMGGPGEHHERLQTHVYEGSSSIPKANIIQNGDAEYIKASSDEEDPVCLVGIACRLPGGVTSPSRLWDFLINQRSGQGKVPRDRFNVDGFHKADETRAGIMNADGGYFIQEDLRQFDCGFFGMNPAEATYLDPQQRKILEVVFECLENAGLTMNEISNTNTGVYVGNFTVDHVLRQARDFDYVHRHSATGSGLTVLSNRISHVFNLQGPSLTLDTACSSSMYALHLAVSAIKSGECCGAIVASSNLITSPEQHYMTLKAGVLSPTSTCHTFDASADGYGRADGVNAVYLTRLSQAIKHKNKAWAVIRSTAINANGRTFGITQPSADLQEAVIKKAYAIAHLSPADTDYVECHGTGTAVGDPIELEAIGRVFCRREGPPLGVGSVKTNLGHSEASSGLTSLIKVALAFEHGKIPPTLNIENLNPKLGLEALNIEVVTKVRDWPRSIRRSSINSFGFGGANAHVIVESPDSFFVRGNSLKKPIISRVANSLLVLPLSAASGKSLDMRRQQIEEMIPRCDPSMLGGLCYTLSERRSHFTYRDFVLAEANGQAKLESAPAGTKDYAVNTQPHSIAFVFTGQGAQYPGMAKELLQQYDVFASTIRELNGVLRASSIPPPWDLEQTLLTSDLTNNVHNADISQTLCAAIQIGIVNVLRAWGIHPSAVIGHSSGEIVAAYAAGLLSASQAILVAYYRGQAVKKAKSTGAMLAAGIGFEAATDLIRSQKLTGLACVACVNATDSVTLSGSVDAIDSLRLILQSQKKFVRTLNTDGMAYHSHMMAEVGPIYRELIQPILQKHSPQADPMNAIMFSSVLLGDKLLDPHAYKDMSKYWHANLENPVHFKSALENLVLENHSKIHMIEIGPHPALKGSIQQMRAELKLDQSQQLPYSSTLTRGQNASISMKALAGRLFCMGYQLDWCNVNGISSSSAELLQSIPPYPWDYSGGLFWHEPRPSLELRERCHLRHELLGSLQLAGNGIEWNWRNILNLSEASWLRDHKIGTQIVFPASGYLSLTMEGLLQIQDSKNNSCGTGLCFEFRNVHIKAALVLPDDYEDGKVEIHTTLAPRKISGVSVSESWYDFTISSWTEGQAALHCTGTIRAAENYEFQQCSIIANNDSLEPWSFKRCYEKLNQEGACFGSHFKSLENLLVDGSGQRAEAIATTELKPETGERNSSYYAMHPITIDACLQAAIVARAKYDVESLHAYLPTSISRCSIRALKPSSQSCKATIQARSKQTGFSTCQIDCNLFGSDGRPFVQFENVHLTRYAEKLTLRSDKAYANLQRNPCFRVCWKPDITCLRPSVSQQLGEYVAAFLSSQPPDIACDEILGTIGALLDLIGHKNPSMSVLSLDSQDCTCKLRQWCSILGKETPFPRYKSWHTGQLHGDGELVLADGSHDPYTTMIISGYDTSINFFERASESARSILSTVNFVIFRNNKSTVRSLSTAGFAVLEVGKHLGLGIRSHELPRLPEGTNIVIVSHQASASVTALADAIGAVIEQQSGVARVSSITLEDMKTTNLSFNTICICLMEVEQEFLAKITPKEMDALQHITSTVGNVLWLSGANMLVNPNPNLSLASGLSRALMLEQPPLQFSILDIGSVEETRVNIPLICRHVSTILLSPRQKRQDKEFIMADQLLYISRLYPDLAMNSLFQRRLGMKEQVQMAKLSAASPVRLSIKKAGVTDTIHFRELREPPCDIPEGYIDVEVNAFSLNAKDVYTMNSRIETQFGTTNLEFSGVVKAIGHGDTNGLKPGDRVVVAAPNYASSVERVPAWAAHKMLPEENAVTMSTILVVYATALYSLIDLGQLRTGESVLIHSGAGAFGMAAITVAQNIGAVVYTTVGSPSKREFLTRQLGIPDSQIFYSRNVDFVEKIQAATQNKGVNVVVNSLTGDMLHASWRCLTKFGRFVEVGKRELVDAGKLDMDMFLRNTTFTAFDFTELFYHEDQYYRDIFIEKTKTALEMYRRGEIEAPPISVFGADKIGEAYRYFSSRNRIGKIVVSLENTSTLTPTNNVSILTEVLSQIAPAKYLTVFDPHKTYLMVGCLGGLGRSLSRWMMARGARIFVFIGRTGADKPQAQKFVTSLEKRGATVTVVRGDISKVEDAQAAVAACTAPIGGIVQGAMGLHEALFSNMTNDAWHAAIQPKWAGSWNLHHALEKHDDKLDFFLLLSSVNGTVGSATESNYCSANSFLDAFAHWRRGMGKPAVSVGLGMISEVGYLHENPQIEAMLLRRGAQPLNEQDFLQVIDLALASAQNEKSDESTFASTCTSPHVVTGLELGGVRQLEEQGFEVTHATANDPRASILTAAYEAEKAARKTSNGDASRETRFETRSSWWDMVPPSAAILFEQVADAPTFETAVLQLVKRKFSALILMSLEKIDDDKPLAQFGVDSMIASEFRTWFWDFMEIDMPFLDLVSPQKSLKSIAKKAENILGARKQTAS